VAPVDVAIIRTEDTLETVGDVAATVLALSHSSDESTRQSGLKTPTVTVSVATITPDFWRVPPRILSHTCDKWVLSTTASWTVQSARTWASRPAPLWAGLAVFDSYTLETANRPVARITSNTPGNLMPIVVCG
jgi:hypothetical protein